MSATPSDETVKLGSSQTGLLGEWCVRRGVATAAEIESCLSLLPQSDESLGALLVSRGILTANQVEEALRAVNLQARRPRVDVFLEGKERLPDEVQSLMGDLSARFGKYVLIRKLGQGGIGVVYLAWDTYLHQYVALKRLRSARPTQPQDTPQEHVQSLLQEARHSIRLRHPGIVSVFDVGRVGREYYVAMEYLDGETLQARIQAAKRQGRPSPYFEDPRRTVNQLIEIARALEYAHSRPAPIIHCDLKPANVLVDRGNRAHVLDFGLARNLALDRPDPGEISGTPAYMAPEQAAGENDKIDPRTDVYAFGAMLYELLTGRPPFVGGTMEVIGKTIVEDPETPTTTLRRIGEKKDSTPPRRRIRIPRALEELCMKCLRKERDQRPQSMEDVAIALEGAFRLETPAPVRPSKRSSFGIAIAVTIAAGITAALALWRPSTEFPPPNPFDHHEAVVHDAIARFDAASARALALRLREESKGGADERRAARLVEEAIRVDQLQSRMAEQLSMRSLELPELRTRRGVRAGIRIDGADRLGLRLVQNGHPEFLGWDQLDPEGLPGLCRAALGDLTEADLLALGIVAHRSIGRPGGR